MTDTTATNHTIMLPRAKGRHARWCIVPEAVKLLAKADPGCGEPIAARLAILGEGEPLPLAPFEARALAGIARGKGSFGNGDWRHLRSTLALLCADACPEDCGAPWLVRARFSPECFPRGASRDFAKLYLDTDLIVRLEGHALRAGTSLDEHIEDMLRAAEREATHRAKTGLDPSPVTPSPAALRHQVMTIERHAEIRAGRGDDEDEDEEVDEMHDLWFHHMAKEDTELAGIMSADLHCFSEDGEVRLERIEGLTSKVARVIALEGDGLAALRFLRHAGDMSETDRAEARAAAWELLGYYEAAEEFRSGRPVTVRKAPPTKA